MVYFNCDACGDSLKKNEVEKHRRRCHNCHILSCVDCNKDFRGNDYQQHTKCVSEEQRYSGKNFKPKPNANKGELKQELWTQQVQEAIRKANNNSRLQGILQQLTNYQNIPRKKQKFENFVISSLHLRDRRLIDEVWNAISAEFQPTQPIKTNSTACVDTENGFKNSADDVHIDKTEKSEAVSGENLADTSELETMVINQKKKEKKKRDKKSEKKNSEATSEEVGEVVEETSNQQVEAAEKGSKRKKDKKKKCKSEQDVLDGCGVNGSMTVEENAEKLHNRKLDVAAVTEIANACGDEIGKKSKKKRQFRELAAEEVEDDNVCKPDTIKRSRTEEASPVDKTETHVGKFNWDSAIIGVLKRAQDNQLPIKKLRKKVLSEFNARHGDGKVYTKEKLLAKFTHKIHNCSRLKVLKEHVKLVDS